MTKGKSKYPELAGIDGKSKLYHALYRKLTHRKTITWMHLARFGGLREAVLERDSYACVHCGMTNEEHKKLWNRDISIDHIDGTGVNTPRENKNNSLDNLQTLCLRCHGRKDALRYWRERSVINK